MADQPLSSIQVELHGNVNGIATFTQLWYESLTLYPLASSSAACDAVYEQVWEAIKPYLSSAFLLSSIQCIVYQIPATQSKPRHIRAVGELGEVNSDSLPPYTTVKMLKIPDNTTLWPENSTLFGLGRTGWAGIPESAQTNGLLNPEDETDFNTAFEAMETLTTTYSDPASYYLAMIRQRNVTGQNWVAHVKVQETQASQILGTQNTRKY